MARVTFASLPVGFNPTRYFDEMFAYSHPVVTTDDILTSASGIVTASQGIIVVSRAAPTATAITLPAVSTRNGAPLWVVDWSTGVTDSPGHVITLTPASGETIARLSTFPIASNSVYLGVAILVPQTALSGWIALG